MNLVGQRLGNYRLIRELGQGGFATVYLAQHVYLGSFAAIKVLSGPIASAAGFLAEARTLAGLIHPRIIRLLDYGVSSGMPYLVMDYAPGGTLRQRHARGEQLPLELVLSYVSQAAEALQFAHDRRFIHRDVKPANLLLGEQGQVLLGDFGIALLAQSSRVTADIVGTITYMAPEQIEGHPRRASDQYALAVVVYEWLSGSSPFTGSFAEIAAKQCQTAPPPLSGQVPGISSEVERVVLQALAKRPAQRFASVQAFAEALVAAAGAVRSGVSTLPATKSPGAGRRLEDDFA